MNSRTQTVQSEWEKWLQENAAKFFLFARQQTRSEQDAEDILQEALVETWRISKGEPSSPLVFATIRRRSIDLYRRTDSRSSYEDQFANEEETIWFQSDLEVKERMLMVQEEIKKLPQEQQQIVTLKIWGELTFNEIAATLSLPQGTVASRYRLALETLRKTIPYTIP